MVRFLMALSVLTLGVFCAPVWAQGDGTDDATEAERNAAKADANDDPSPKVRVGVAALEQQKEFVTKLQSLLQQLDDKDPKTRTAARESLRTLLKGNRMFMEIGLGGNPDGAPTRLGGLGGFTGLPGFGGAAIQILVPDRGSRETIRGTAREKGKSIRYELRSLGGGRYELKLESKTSTPNSTTSASSTDQGSLGELFKRHPFLKESGSVFVEFVRPGDPGAMLVRSGARPLVSAPSAELRHHLEIPTDAGLVIRRVPADSRMNALGLKKYDILIRAGGDVMDDAKHLSLLEKPSIEVEYIRRGKRRTLTTPAK